MRDRSEYHRAYEAKHAARISERKRQYYLANKERIDERNKKYNRENHAVILAAGRRFHGRNKEKRAAARKEWAVANRDKVAAFAAERRAMQLRATPKWANEFFIGEAYHLAKLRTKVTGIPWHVDHIVPLKSKVVCGLHVENNLRVIPAALNWRKRNAFVVT